MDVSTEPIAQEQISAAATKLFAEKGFTGTTVKEIADRAGVNVSMISYYYGGKENLYRHCLEKFGRERLDVSQRLLQKPQTREELRVRLDMFIDELLLCFAENRDTCQLIQRECEMNLPVAQDIFRNTFLKTFQNLVAFLEHGKKMGFLNKSLDASVCATVIYGTIKHFLSMGFIADKFLGFNIQKPSTRNLIKEQLLILLTNGFIAKGKEVSS